MNSNELHESQSDCVFCGKSECSETYSCTDTRGNQWSWGRCESCGTLSLLPHPTAADLSLAYDTSYYGSSDTKFEGLSEKFISYCRRGRARKLAVMLQPKARVLDIGCGSGEFLAALSAYGDYELWGTELSGPAASRATKHQGVNLKVGPLCADDFEEHSFDMVTLFHVFEHLPNPSEVIESVRRILKPDGHLIMSFPNINSWQAKLFKGNWLHLDPPRHLFLMPPASFEREIRNFGFEIESRQFYSIEQNPYGFIQSLLNQAGFPRDLLYERLKGNNDYSPEYGSWSVMGQKFIAGLCLLPAVFLDAIESTLGKGATVLYHLKRTTSS